MRRHFEPTKDQLAAAERNRKIFNRALKVIGWYSKKTREEIIEMLSDDNNSAWQTVNGNAMPEMKSDGETNSE